MTKLKTFLSRFNFCEPLNPDGTEKPPSRLYDWWALLFTPIPDAEAPCWCCAGLRGVLIGLVVGLFVGFWL